MKSLLEIIVKNLVDYPNEVSVKEEKDGDSTILTLSVNQDDMGKVIGKQGKIAKAIRTVIKAAAISKEQKVTIEIK